MYLKLKVCCIHIFPQNGLYYNHIFLLKSKLFLKMLVESRIFGFLRKRVVFCNDFIIWMPFPVQIPLVSLLWKKKNRRGGSFQGQVGSQKKFKKLTRTLPDSSITAAHHMVTISFSWDHWNQRYNFFFSNFSAFPQRRH